MTEQITPEVLQRMATAWLETFQKRTEEKDHKGIQALFHKEAILFGRFSPKPSDMDFDLENAKLIPFPPACAAILMAKPSAIVSKDNSAIRWTFLFVIEGKAFVCVHAHCSRSTTEQLITPVNGNRRPGLPQR